MPSHERRITMLALLTGLPAIVIALVLLWTGDIAARTQWTLTIGMVLFWIICAFALREQVVRPLQTLSNMLAAIREQDYSLRSRRADPDDALGLTMLEVNTLMGELREQRLGALEATSLLRRVMAEVDVAVLAFDDTDALRVINAAGERLLGQSAEQLLGHRADELGLASCLEGEVPRVLDLALGSGSGRWEIRRGEFRQGGLPHRFLVMTDVGRALREEERLAWRRLIRVLGHEINNSLTPIRSLSEHLRQVVARTPLSAPIGDDLEKGLGVIASRAEGLTRFLAAYARLAKLPAPKPVPLDVEAWVRRVCLLEQRLPVEIEPCPPAVIQADGDLLDQLLINLVANAADAALETRGGVRIRWATVAHHFLLEIEDDGPGLPDSANLFVPFFTTKPGGTGVGLVLSRQIAEAHGGTLALVARSGRRGCVARLMLPA